MPAHFLATLPNFLAYFAAAIALLAAFVAIYLYVTPYDEIRLIRNNNVAAAVSLSGAVLGFGIGCTATCCALASAPLTISVA